MPNKHKQPVITLDGTSGAGKSTLNKGLTKVYGERNVRSLEYSLFFRIIAKHMIDQGFVIPKDGAGPSDADIQEAVRFAETLKSWEDVKPYQDDAELNASIRTSEVEKVVPFFGGHPSITVITDKVFHALIDNSNVPVIAEGRTVGRYIYPDADVKFYVDADVAERGKRRATSKRKAGKDITDQEEASALAVRDHYDHTRENQPTGYHEPVHTLVDTTVPTAEQTRENAIAFIEERAPVMKKIREQKAKAEQPQNDNHQTRLNLRKGSGERGVG